MPTSPDPARYAALCFFKLLDDSYFRQWVRIPSAESDAFFTALQMRHPHQAQDLADAHTLLSFLSCLPVEQLPGAEAELLWNRVKRDTEADDALFVGT